MKKLHIALSLILFLCLVFAGCSLDTDDKTVSVSGDLAYYAEMDADILEEKCKGNYIEVSGTVYTVYQNIGKIHLGNSSSDKIQFSCDFSDSDDIANIEIGDLVTVRGKCSSYIGSTIYLQNCEVKKNTNQNKSESKSSTTETTNESATESTTSSTTEAPHTHNFSAATCTTPKTCSCGTTTGNPNGHNWNLATYTSPKTCSACGITEGDPLDVPGKENYHGHVYTGGSSSKKYHYEAQCAGKNSHEITWEDVQRRNLGPCGTCVLK